MVDGDDVASIAFDAGINFFFLTADMHWPLYENARRGLAKLLASRKGIRDEIVVGVVSYCTQPEFCTLPFRELLDAMPGLRRIDVAIAGGAHAGEILGRLPVYRTHRQNAFLGVRAIGASFHDRSAALDAIEHELFDVAFVRYNPTHPGAREDLFPSLSRESASAVFNFSSTNGHLSRNRLRALGLSNHQWLPKVTDYYRFAISRPEIAGLLCALRTGREIRALERALATGPLAEDEETYLINLSRLDRGEVELRRKRSR